MWPGQLAILLAARRRLRRTAPLGRDWGSHAVGSVSLSGAMPAMRFFSRPCGNAVGRKASEDEPLLVAVAERARQRWHRPKYATSEESQRRFRCCQQEKEAL